MAHNGGPRVPPRPPPITLAGVHHTAARNIPPPPPSGAAPGSSPAGQRAPATMSVISPPLTAPLSPLGSRHQQQYPHHHRLAPPGGSLTRRVSPARSPTGNDVSSGLAPVTLTSPRPDGERVVNEYVETPFSRGSGQPGTPSPVGIVGSNNTNISTTNNGAIISPTITSAAISPVLQTTNKPPHQTTHAHHRPDTLPLQVSGVITKQPHATFTKNHRSVLGRDSIIECQTGGGTTRTSSGAAGSIICSECGRCRCESCQQPRPLPQRWVCDKKCLCSVDAIIDYTSCLCCVKGLYYHCSKDYELDRDGVSCADEPCSCAPHRRMMRWGCLLALTAALPCLLCYWPLRGCARGLEVIYAQHTRSGCRCRPAAQYSAASTLHHHHAQQDALTTPEKRLLDSSPDF